MSTADRVANILISRHNGKRTGNRIQSNSPYRADSDSMGFSLTIEGDEHGAFMDHARNTGGSLYELAQHLGIETPKRTDIEASLKAYTGLSDYAQHKGVSADVFERAKWTQVTHMNRPALQFPTASGIRYRFLDGNKPKFISEHGYKACLYGLKNAPTLAQSSNLPMILTNGEPSVIVAQHHGLPAVCKTSGETQLPSHILDELLNAWSGSFVIALDCDETGRNASQKIAKQLTDVGRVAIIVDLMLGDKGDLADFCKLHADGTIKAFTERVKVSNPYTPPDKTAEKVDELNKALGALTSAVKAKETDITRLIEATQARLDSLARDTIAPKIVTPDNVIENLLSMVSEGFDGIRTGLTELDKHIGGITRGAPTVIYGATGMGKSTFTASICANLEIRGLKICYVTTELSPHKYMVSLITAMTGIRNTDIYNNTIPQAKYRDFTDAVRIMRDSKSTYVDSIAPSASQLKMSVRQAVDKGADLVVVDSATNLAPAGDYLKTYEMQSAILELARETNLPFLVTSQVSRSIINRADRMPKLNDGSGGGMIENNAHNVIGLYRHSYYVDRHEDEPNDDFPVNTVRGIYLKTRTAGVEGKFSTFAYFGGIGVTNLNG